MSYGLGDVQDMLDKERLNYAEGIIREQEVQILRLTEERNEARTALDNALAAAEGFCSQNQDYRAALGAVRRKIAWLYKKIDRLTAEGKAARAMLLECNEYALTYPPTWGFDPPGLYDVVRINAEDEPIHGEVYDKTNPAHIERVDKWPEECFYFDMSPELNAILELARAEYQEAHNG